MKYYTKIKKRFFTSLGSRDDVGHRQSATPPSSTLVVGTATEDHLHDTTDTTLLPLNGGTTPKHGSVDLTHLLDTGADPCPDAEWVRTMIPPHLSARTWTSTIMLNWLTFWKKWDHPPDFA